MTKNKAEAKTQAKTLGGSEFVPDIGTLGPAVSTRKAAYWLGLTMDCPVLQIDMAGISFQKNQELVHVNSKTRTQTRIPVFGGLDKSVTIETIEKLRKHLPRLVLRFLGAPAIREESGSGINTGDDYKRARKAILIRIPTEQEIKEAKAERRNVPKYVRDPRDEPAANYMFFHLCDNQADPKRGAVIPESIADVGIFWPEETAETTANFA